MNIGSIKQTPNFSTPPTAAPSRPAAQQSRPSSPLTGLSLTPVANSDTYAGTARNTQGNTRTGMGTQASREGFGSQINRGRRPEQPGSQTAPSPAPAGPATQAGPTSVQPTASQAEVLEMQLANSRMPQDVQDNFRHGMRSVGSEAEQISIREAADSLSGSGEHAQRERSSAILEAIKLPGYQTLDSDHRAMAIRGAANGQDPAQAVLTANQYQARFGTATQNSPTPAADPPPPPR